MNERLYSARDAEKVLGISASTIRTWWRRYGRKEGGLWDYGTDRRGNPMFRAKDLIALRDKRPIRD